MMRIGWLVNLNEDPYECIRHAAVDLDLRCGQLSVWDMSFFTKENADIVLKACKDFDFSVTALWCGWSFKVPRNFGYPQMYSTIGLVPTAWRAQRTQDILKGAAWARLLGVKDIISHVGYVPDDPFNEVRVGVRQALRYICYELGLHGQRFLFETGEMIPNTLIQLMVETGMDNIGVNFDCANMIINARGNAVDSLRMLVPYVHGVHIKDAHYPQGTSPKGKEVRVGEGEANFPALIQILKENGYEGDLTIEREISDVEERDRDILNTKKYIENLLNN